MSHRNNSEDHDCEGAVAQEYEEPSQTKSGLGPDVPSPTPTMNTSKLSLRMKLDPMADDVKKSKNKIRNEYLHGEHLSRSGMISMVTR